MDNYEINILKRGGNWRKVQADDLISDDVNEKLEKYNELKDKNSNDNFYSYISKVNEIITKLETLEDQKNILKEELKSYEDIFLKKKKIAEDNINKFSQERNFIEKTLKVLKNLKSF